MSIKLEESKGGVKGFASWDRLADILRKAGELRDDERVVAFERDNSGLSWRVEFDPDAN